MMFQAGSRSDETSFFFVLYDSLAEANSDVEKPPE